MAKVQPLKLNNLGVSHRFLILVLVPLIMNLVFMGALAFSLEQAERESEREARSKQAVAELELSGKLIGDCLVFLAYSMYFKDPAYRRKCVEAKANTISSLKTLKSIYAGDPERLRKINKIEAVSGRAFYLFMQIFPSSERADEEQIYQLGATLELRAIKGEYEKLLSQLQESEHSSGASSHQKSVALKNALKDLILLGFIVNVLVSVVVASLFTKGIATRLLVLFDNMMRLASDKPLNENLAGNDEIAQLDRSFHEMAEALETSLLKERAAINNAREVICSLDSNMRFTAVNPASLEIWGFLSQELLAKRLAEIIDIDDAQQVLNTLRQLISSESAETSFDCGVICDNGDNIQTSWSVSWSSSEQAFFCVSHDITERHRNEALLKDRETRTRMTVDSLPIGVLTVNSEGKLEAANQLAGDLVGRQHAELIGRSIRDLFQTDPQTLTGTFIRAVLERSASQSHEMDVYREDGTSFPAEVTLSEIFSLGERKYLIVVTDISERKHLEQMKQEFVAIVSHDLRTPMTTLMGTFDLFLKGLCGEVNDTGRETLGASLEEIDRVIVIINNLLDMERIESGQMNLQKEVTGLEDIVSQAVNTVAYLADKNGIQLTNNVESIELFADEGSLVRVMVNLLDNAIKFSPSGSTTSITSSVIEDSVEVRISDQGRGIPRDRQDMIFDRFKQMDQIDNAQGVPGLGLAICRAIVQSHGGQIGLVSDENKGATFWWRLPIPAVGDDL